MIISWSIKDKPYTNINFLWVLPIIKTVVVVFLNHCFLSDFHFLVNESNPRLGAISYWLRDFFVNKVFFFSHSEATATWLLYTAETVMGTLAYQIKHAQIPQAHWQLCFEWANFETSFEMSFVHLNRWNPCNKETKTHLGINSIWSSGQSLGESSSKTASGFGYFIAFLPRKQFNLKTVTLGPLGCLAVLVSDTA